MWGAATRADQAACRESSFSRPPRRERQTTSPVGEQPPSRQRSPQPQAPMRSFHVVVLDALAEDGGCDSARSGWPSLRLAASRPSSTCGRLLTGRTPPPSASTSRGCGRSSTGSPPTLMSSPALARSLTWTPRQCERTSVQSAGTGWPNRTWTSGTPAHASDYRLVHAPAGAGLGCVAGRTVPPRRDRPAARLHRQPVLAALNHLRVMAFRNLDAVAVVTGRSYGHPRP